jgi:hypothetical protein
MRKPEAGITSENVFVGAGNSENVGRALQAIGWRTLKISTRKRSSFGIPRGIDEGLHFDWKNTPTRMEMRDLDFTCSGFDPVEIGVEKNGQVWSSALQFIRHRSEGGGVVRKDIEFSHSHRAGCGTRLDETLGKLSREALVAIGQRLGVVISQEVKPAERVNKRIGGHAAKGAAPLDEERLRTSPRGGHGGGDPGRATTHDKNVEFFRGTHGLTLPE